MSKRMQILPLPELNTGQERMFLARIVWAVLAFAASQGKTLTYQQMGMLIDRAPRSVSWFLKPIGSFCLLNDLPRLDCLVVAGRTGRPGDKGKKFPDGERERVFGKDWLAMTTPEAGAFAKAVEKIPDPDK